jgi:5-methyltetrahydrofolate--homocysteine methyltransferase
MHAKTQEIFNAVLDGNAPGAQAAVKAALAEGLDPAGLLNEGMIAAMKEVGRRFEEGDYFVPEMLIAARAMQSGLALLKPYLKDADIKPAGKVAIGTVKGDLHDIGKNLVGMMLEGGGFEVIDLGTDVAPEKFVDAVVNNQVQLIGLSALLTTTMSNMKSTIDALQAAGVREQVKVIIGGAPVTEDYAVKIGADGFSSDASRAVALAQTLMGVG